MDQARGRECGALGIELVSDLAPRRVSLQIGPGPTPSADTQDVRYLAPHINQVLAENKERAEWDSITVERRK